jgi:hypothetical protein
LEVDIAASPHQRLYTLGVVEKTGQVEGCASGPARHQHKLWYQNLCDGIDIDS